MARDGYFFRSVARVHPVLRAPSRSVALQGLIAMVIVVSGSFDQILTYMGFSLGIFPIFAVLGVFKLRRRGLSVTRMPGYPVAPAIYLLAGTAILVLGFLQSPGPSGVALLTMAAGVPAFYFFRKKGKVNEKRKV